MFSCDNEARLCLESPSLDFYYQLEAANWHSACDTFISFSVTTPVISSLTSTLDQGACEQVWGLCESGLSSKTNCASTATASIDLLSCMCQPAVTSLYSACLWGGNVSCYGVPGNTDGIIGRSFCLEFQTATVRTFHRRRARPLLI